MSDDKTPSPKLESIEVGSAHNALNERAVKSTTPFYMSGVDDRPQDARIVAVAVRARCELKVGDREFSGCLCLHEIAVMRRFYEMRGGGSIRATPGWLPALSRHVPLVHDKLRMEAERMAKTFVVPRAGQPPIMCFAEFFGQAPSEQLTRLHAVMRQQYEAWSALLEKAKARLEKLPVDQNIAISMANDLITERELEELIAIADPSKKGMDEIELPEVEMAPETPAVSLESAKAAADADPGDDLDKRLTRLRDAGATEKQAFDIASLLEIVGDLDKISDQDIAKAAGGKARVEAYRAALRG